MNTKKFLTVGAASLLAIAVSQNASAKEYYYSFTNSKLGASFVVTVDDVAGTAHIQGLNGNPTDVTFTGNSLKNFNANGSGGTGNPAGINYKVDAVSGSFFDSAGREYSTIFSTSPKHTSLNFTDSVSSSNNGLLIWTYVKDVANGNRQLDWDLKNTITPTSAPPSPPPTSTGTPPTSTGTPPTSTGTPPTSTGTPPTSTGTPPTSTGTPPTTSGTSVPGPGMVGLFALGAAGLAASRRRKKRAKKDS